MSNYKWKNIKKGITAAALALAMLVGMSSAQTIEVKADGFPKDTLKTSAVMTKELVIPSGVKAPDVSFNFSVTPKGSEAADGTWDQSGTAGATWAIPSIVLTDSRTGDGNNKIVENVNITTLLQAQIANFPHAGVFYYEVEETATTGDDAANVQDSKVKYVVKVYVVNDDNEPSKLKIAGVTVVKTVDENGDNITSPAKVDPTPDSDTYLGGDFIFVNKYLENTQVKIQKNVTGNAAGDYGDRSKDFNFTVTVKLPSTAADVTSVSYVKTNASGATGAPQPVTISSLTGIANITLKHGEFITFISLPVGSTYKVVEAAAPGYTPSAVVTGAGTNGTSAVGTAGDPYTVFVGTENLILQPETNDIKNTTVVTNQYRQVYVTGVLIENLPFIMLIIVAALGLVYMIFSRRRRTLR